MGRKTYVSSSISNLGQGDDSESKFLTAAVISGVLSRSGEVGLGSYISNTLLASNGANLKQYFRWAKNYYTPGLPDTKIEDYSVVDASAVLTAITNSYTLTTGTELYVYEAWIDNGDIDYFAEDWVRQNYPNTPSSNWSAYYNFTTNKMIVVLNGTSYTVNPPSDLAWAMTAPRASKRLLYYTWNYVTKNATTLAITRGTPALETYRQGSGNTALDVFFNSDTSVDEFYPELPLRINNVSINDPSMSSTKTQVDKAFKKLTGSSIDYLAEQIDNNAQVDSIDHAFIMHGVPLNTSNQSGLQYIYKFFENLIAYQGNTSSQFALFENAQGSLIEDEINEARWSLAFENTPEPAHPLYVANADLGSKASVQPPSFTLKIDGSSSLDLRLRWNNIREIMYTGNGARFDNNQTRPLLKRGEHLVIQDTVSSFKVKQWQNGNISWNDEDLPKFYLIRQYAKDYYSVLEITGAMHSNYVYGSHAVHITAAEAFADSGESPFLVPLHFPTVKEMGINELEDLSRNCSYLLVNSYQIVRTSWWQDNFRWIIAVVTIVIVIASGGTASGLLGTNLSVGTAVGLTGTAAVIAGAVINMVAAAVVTSLIMKASTKLFGEKAGRIIGVIASFLTINYMSGNFGETFELVDLFNADSLIAATNAASNAYVSALNADTMDIIEEMDNAQTAYEEESERIMELAEEVLGVTNNAFNPMIFTDATEYFGESRQSFLDRTLMTGSDIAQVSHGIIEDFVDLTLALPRSVA
jgi:hypothetical protein